MSSTQDPALLLPRIFAAQDSLTVAWETKNNTDIDISINKWETLARQIRPDYERYSDVLASYAVALLLRWRKRHRVEDIDAAITILEKVVSLSEEEDPTIAQYECYANLGGAYMDRWETLNRQPTDLVKAADKWESAHTLALRLGRNAESATAILPNLGEAYCFAYAKKLLDLPVVQMAIDHFKVALSFAPESDHGSLNYKIGKAYSALYLTQEDAEDFQSAAHYLRQATSGELSDEEMEDAAMELSDLFVKDYGEGKSRESLDAAIYWARRAAHVKYQDGDLQILRRVGSLLTFLYKDFQDTSALDAAISCYDQIWSSPTGIGEDASTFYYNFGTVLLRRSAISTADSEDRHLDLSRAIELLQLAVDNAGKADVFVYQTQLSLAKERLSNEFQQSFSHLWQQQQPPSPNPRDRRLLRSSTVPFSQEPFPMSQFTAPIYGGNVFNSTRVDPRPPMRQYSVPSQFSAVRDPAWRSDTPDIQVWATYPVEAELVPIHADLRRPIPPTNNQDTFARLGVPARSSLRRNHMPARDLTEEEASPEVISPNASIKPTNLTGRVVKTAEFPFAEGGFSAIYTGNFGTTKVAIKVIKKLNGIDVDTLKRRLRREMDVWWKLDHPNIVPLWGYTDAMGGMPSMIAPWYENGNATNYVQKAGLGVEFRLQLLREVSSGLRYLHDRLPVIVHGDLKPGNVLIDNDGVARLCDFGLAHLVAAESENSATPAGNVGTIRYAAPELRCPVDDDDVVRATTSTDIYSLACIGYEFLYKKQPFAEKASIQAIIAAGYSHIPPARRANEDATVLGSTTPHYWSLFEACWDEDAAKRPDIAAFCEQIDLAFHAIAFAN